jgi:surface polysaccharide O-acyltransferase-like enzyme
LWRLLVKSRNTNPPVEAKKYLFPRNGAIAIFALLLGLAGFIVRVFFVMDVERIVPLNLQLPFFAQYIALFIVGLVAYRKNWLRNLPDKTGRFWLVIALILILLWVPMMFANGAVNGNVFQKGGWHWQSLVYALWESFLCISMCIGLIYTFRRYLNCQNRVNGFMIPNAYTAYLIHAPIITILALALQNVTLYPLLKWAIMAVVAVPICFGLSGLIRKIPYTDRVL